MRAAPEIVASHVARELRSPDGKTESSHDERLQRREQLDVSHWDQAWRAIRVSRDAAESDHASRAGSRVTGAARYGEDGPLTTEPDLISSPANVYRMGAPAGPDRL